MRKKSFLYAVMCAVLLFASIPMTTMANDECASYLREGTKVPEQIGGTRYADIQSYSLKTSVSGSTVYSELRVSTKNGSTRTSGTMYLQRKNGNTWENVATWSISKQGTFSVRKSYTGSTGSRYRTKISIRVGSDSISDTSNEATVG